MPNEQRLMQLRALLEDAFAPTVLTIVDDSWQHAGHAGAAGHGGGHFSIDITAAAFVGKSRMQCHRMVMTVVRPMFAADIHALSIRTHAPETEA